MLFPDGRKKALTLSYDDGDRQDRRLADILDKYGIKATFNVNSGFLGEKVEYDRNDGRMSADELKSFFASSCHEAAIHGFEHAYGHVLHDNCMIKEIIGDRENIEKMTGRITRGMAYPFGTFNDRLKDKLKACGVAYSRTVNSTGGFELPDDWLELNPTCHHSDKRLFDLCDIFLCGNPNLAQMFYLWGHSHEFDNNTEYNNWEIIEAFAKKMGRHESIWYATNIEIYDYVQAYNRLNISTDFSIVHNPNSVDVWFRKGDWESGEVYCVKLGETIYI